MTGEGEVKQNADGTGQGGQGEELEQRKAGVNQKGESKRGAANRGALTYFERRQGGTHGEGEGDCRGERRAQKQKS